MAKLVKLEIKNFRCIKNLSLDFDATQNLVCLIGRGDSGKTTILDAISAVLSPAWNLTFNDTDFYNCDHKNTIEVFASLVDVPEKLRSAEKVGLYQRLFNTKTKEIIDDILIEETDTIIPLLTIRLVVDQSLEPQWTVTNSREQVDKNISAAERSMLNCYLISDYVDRHFSWNKGNPLYSLLKALDGNSALEESNVVIQSLRLAKNKIDEYPFDELQKVTELITIQASALGLNILKANTTIDFKEFSIKDGRISLHENLIPFRLKGKGSKRLISLAIQLALVKDGGVILVDEIEQGLEPDRIKQIVRTLKENDQGQIFVTTHSREVITELGSAPLCLILRDEKGEIVEGRKLDHNQVSLVNVVRACPEAFFAKKVIVCEGATEIGLCRALDRYRSANHKKLMSFNDCAYVDGTGDSLIDRAVKIHESGIKTALLCDSDKNSINDQKEELRKKGILVYDCEQTNCIEKQLFDDLPWAGIQDLISYVLITHKKNDLNALESSIKSKFSPGTNFTTTWLTTDTNELRKALVQTSVVSGKEWFKRIDHGEAVGDIVFKYFTEMDDNCHLKKMLTSLSNWIDS